MSDSSYNRGNAYDGKGEYDLAIKDYTMAICLKTDDAQAYNNRGTAYGKKGNFDAAIKDFTTAIRHQPDHAGAYYNCGIAYDEKGEYDLAIKDYTMVIKHQPDYANAYYNRGISWLYLREWENFRSDLSAARDVGVDIAIGFRNLFGSVANFERITGIQLPADIAAMLTSSS